MGLYLSPPGCYCPVLEYVGYRKGNHKKIMSEPCDSCSFTQYPYAVHPNCSHLPACPRNLVGQLREELDQLREEIEKLRKIAEEQFIELRWRRMEDSW